MTPGARVQAAIEVLDDILSGRPAEQALTGWARRSRFAGSKDRRAVRDHVFQALRCRRSYAACGAGLSGRGLMIGALRSKGVRPETVFTSEGYAPATLTDEELSFIAKDPQAEWDLPDWLIAEFRAVFAEKALPTARLLTGRAPVMLRVNLRHCSVTDAVAMLAKDGIVTQPHPIAPAALQVTEGAPRLASGQAYLSGAVELQDGASQSAMQAIEIAPDARVLDFCAGGGGKVLALAARAEAQWFAHDAAPQRMADLPARAHRAGVQVTLLDGPELTGQPPFDVILCDVPCSGSGTWRRTPEAKWRLTPDRLRELTEMQAQILDQASRLLTPEGQLIYTTCSVLPVENKKQIQLFMRRNSGWTLAGCRDWEISDGGDGFFLAHLCREV